MLEGAERALASSTKPDAYALTSALNDVASIIAPVTVADLRYGRDPFLPENQRRARIIQLCLTFFSLVVLVLTGYFMNSLHREQDALVTLEKIQDLKPQQKLTELRKMAQWEQPLGMPRTPNTLYDQYHAKAAELSQINSRVVDSYTTAVVASEIPLFPFQNYFSKAPSLIPTPPQPAITIPQSSGAPTVDTRADATTVRLSRDSENQDGVFCGEDPSGELRLPEESKNYPKWMKTALRDTLNDFCFQLKVIAPGGEGALLSQSLNQLEFVNKIKEKVSLRTAWFLPFMFGLLGSAVYMMRNVASVRTAAVDPLAIIMRVSLGGVAGIVVGWFGTPNAAALEANKLLSLPFALAFLTGYGIEVLFSLLDRLNRAIGEVPSK